MTLERIEGQEVFRSLRPEQVKAIGDVAEAIERRAGDMIYEKDTRADDFCVVFDGQVSLRLHV